jgi:hypothetical protein
VVGLTAEGPRGSLGATRAGWRGIETRRWGLGAVAVGVAAQGAGLGVDAWQHARDETLAAREGVFTLTNVGHALFFAGLVLSAIGVLMAIAGHRLYGPPERRVARHQRLMQIGVPVAVAALVTAGAVGASRSSLAGGTDHHAHDESSVVASGTGSADSPSADSPSAASPAEATADHPHLAGTPADAGHPASATGATDGVAAAAPAAGSDPGAPAVATEPAAGHTHTPNADQLAEAQPDQPLDAATRAALANELTAAREAVLRYPTAGDAAAAGYVLAGGFAPGSGAHYVNFATAASGTFDAGAPDTLVYAGTEPSSPIVGAMYTSLGSDAPIEGFSGPNDHWHRHFNVCVVYGADGIKVPFPADRDVTSEQCSAVGGSFMPTTVWMVHAWVVPAWESPLGVFSHDNPNVRCADGTTNTDPSGFCAGITGTN